MLLNIKLVVVLSLSSSPYMEMMTTDRTREKIKTEPIEREKKKREKKRRERKRERGEQEKREESLSRLLTADCCSLACICVAAAAAATLQRQKQ